MFPARIMPGGGGGEEEGGEGESPRLRDKVCTNSKILVAVVSSAVSFALAALSIAIAQEIAGNRTLARKLLQRALGSYYAEENGANNGSISSSIE
jgi:hypothetical protein